MSASGGGNAIHGGGTNNGTSGSSKVGAGSALGPTNFKKGDIVWAKVRGYSWWPAKIGEIIEGRHLCDWKYKVDFLGDNTH